MRICSKPLYVAALILPISVLAACRGGGSGGEDNGISSDDRKLLVQAVKMTVAGIRESNREKNTSLNPSDFEGHYVQQCNKWNKSSGTATIKSDQITTERVFYENENCTVPTKTIVHARSLVFYKETTMTDHGEAVHVDTNSISYSINGEIQEREPYIKYDLWLLEDNKLRFGDIYTDFDKRPTEVNGGYPYVKQ